MSGGRIEHALGFHYADLRDFEFRLVVRGRPFVLKNSKVISTLIMPAKQPTSRKRCPRCKTPLSVIPKVLPSKEAEAYLEHATMQLRAQWASVFREPIPAHVEVNATIITYRATRHRNDASNLYQAPEDALQAAGVLVDDFQIGSHDGSRRRHDPADPRVELVLTPYRDGAAARDDEPELPLGAAPLERALEAREW